MTKKTIQFSPVDTWFFRNSLPFESNGELQSLFPPSIRTLSGAIRTWIGNNMQQQSDINWKDFKTNANNPLRKIIGSHKEGELGQLNFQGVWLSNSEQRLYPVPHYILKKAHDDTLYPLQLAEKGIHCDLGKSIRLAELPSKKARGAKPLENTWVDEKTLLQLLEGKQTNYCETRFIGLEQLIKKESRIGIARNNKRRTVEEGMLYQIQQIRPEENVKLEIDITGFPENLPQVKNTLIRLGGESRMAIMNETKYQPLPLPQPDKRAIKVAKGVLLYLLTPLKLADSKQMLPDFKYINASPVYWQGDINHISLKLYGAVTGKTIRDGGWNLATGKPRIDTSLIPAGSVFFCEVNDEDIEKAIKCLHGQQIGEQQYYGYGHIAAGLWT